jgi:hypothetical protein
MIPSGNYDQREQRKLNLGELWEVFKERQRTSEEWKVANGVYTVKGWCGDYLKHEEIKQIKDANP